jgi:Protein of unknown function (DUF2933)
MTSHDHVRDEVSPVRKLLAWRIAIVLVAFLAIAGALLLTEHRAHVLGVLIYLPLLACPLMHFFMHGGHGGHGGHGANQERTRP